MSYRSCNKDYSRLIEAFGVPFGVGTGSQEGGGSPSPTLNGAGEIYK